MDLKNTFITLRYVENAGAHITMTTLFGCVNHTLCLLKPFAFCFLYQHSCCG